MKKSDETLKREALEFRQNVPAKNRYRWYMRALRFMSSEYPNTLERIRKMNATRDAIEILSIGGGEFEPRVLHRADSAYLRAAETENKKHHYFSGWKNAAREERFTNRVIHILRAAAAEKIVYEYEYECTRCDSVDMEIKFMRLCDDGITAKTSLFCHTCGLEFERYLNIVTRTYVDTVIWDV